MVILNVLGFELLKIYIFIQYFRQKYTDFFFFLEKEDSDFYLFRRFKMSSAWLLCLLSIEIRLKANIIWLLMYTKCPQF